MSGKQKPLIRFKGFTEAWEQRKVTEIGKIYIGLVTTMTKYYTEDGTLLIRNSDIKDGRFEFGANPIYLEKSFAQKNESRMHQLGDVITVHTGDVGTSAVITENEVKSIGFATIVTRPNQEIIDSNYLCSFLNTDKHKKWAVGVSTGDGRTNYNLGNYYELIVPVPSVKEQQKITTFIQKLNCLITLHQRKLEKLKNIKKSCLEKMFPNNGKNIPEIRFFGFTEAWEQRKLGDMMNVTSVKRIHQSDWTDSGIRFLRARDIVSAYKNEEPDNYLYISKEKYDEYSLISGKVSIGDMLVTGVGTIGVPYLVDNSEPLYFKDGNIIWFKNEDRIDGKFLFYAFFGKSIQNYIIESAGIGTVGTYTIESGKNTPITLPKKEEQKLIGIYFQQLDYLITLHQRKLEKLKNIKKSMLEKMFV